MTDADLILLGRVMLALIASDQHVVLHFNNRLEVRASSRVTSLEAEALREAMVVRA